MNEERLKLINPVVLRNGSVFEITKVDSVFVKIQILYQENPMVVTSIVGFFREAHDPAQINVSLLPYETIISLWKLELLSREGVLEESFRDVFESAVVQDPQNRISLRRPYDLPPFIEKRLRTIK